MKKLSPLLGALWLCAPAIAQAHPHIFAEARLEVVGDDKGGIAELRNVWRFDEIFSSSVLMDFDKNTNLKLDPDELAEVGKTVRESLGDFNYYMSVSENGKSIPVSPPDIINVDYKDGQLLMFFSVKPSMAMPLKGKLAFGVYDPTFYTAIDFTTDDDLAIIGDGPKACQHAVIRPDPDQVLADNKATLTDAFFNDPAGTDTSKLFATRLELTC